MPEAATADEIANVYMEGWKLGLKAIAIYRDGSKRSQPLSTGKKKDKEERGRGGRSGTQGRARWRAQAISAPPAGRATCGHAQVPGCRPRGLHHGRAVPGWSAGRDLPAHGQGRQHGQRPDGLARDDDLHLAPVRRAAARPGQQVQPHALRAQPASPATARSPSPSRSSTTSSAGWALGSWARTTATRWASSRQTRTSWRSRRPTRLLASSAAGLAFAAPVAETPAAAETSGVDLTKELIGEAGGPKASAAEDPAQPPRAEAVDGTDLPVLSNGHCEWPCERPLERRVGASSDQAHRPGRRGQVASA